MVFIQSIILVFLAVSFYFGQLLRINLGQFSFPILDIFAVLFAIVNLFNFQKPKNLPLLFFVIYSWVNLLINYLISGHSLTTASAYLFLLTCLLSFFIFPPTIDKKTKTLFYLVIIANIIFGFIQYFLWSDLTYFKSLGWDDHLNRLVSTFMDPTFTGLIFLLFSVHLYFRKQYKLLAISLLAIFLTYSRSTFLSLIIASLFISFKQKQIKTFILGSIIVIFAILLLPRPPGEGTKLERTSSVNAKYVNLVEAITLFKKSPLIGVGYNNLPVYRYVNNHSSGGFDSSLLTILTTTGLIGLLLFVWGLYRLFNTTTLPIQTMLVAIITHSLFANSLLYPFTLIFLILI